MNYQSGAEYRGGYRPLPRPSSSGTLPGGPQYEQASKRQRVQELPPVLATSYAPQPLPYHIPTSNVAYPYPMHSPQVPRPMPLSYASNEWSSQQVWGQGPSQAKPQHQSAEDKPVLGDNESEDEEPSLGADPEEQGTEAAGEQMLTVPGTSITLVTEEDIIKWREQRKRMWLLKISNNKQKHMLEMGIKEEELKGQKSALQETKKQKQFIQSIQNQVNRINPRSTLSVRIAQREMAKENSDLLDFIEKLGDAGLLNCELTDDEKEKLFGFNDNFQRKGRNDTKNYDTRGSTRTYNRR